MKFVLLLSLAVCYAVAWEGNWEQFKADFNKHYKSPQDEEVHRQNFLKAQKEVFEHNKKFATGEVSYAKALNKFADLSPEEFKQLVKESKEGGAWIRP